MDPDLGLWQAGYRDWDESREYRVDGKMLKDRRAAWERSQAMVALLEQLSVVLPHCSHHAREFIDRQVRADGRRYRLDLRIGVGELNLHSACFSTRVAVHIGSS